MPIYFKLSAELTDGQSCEITPTAVAMVERITDWVTEFGQTPGASFLVEVVELSREEFKALPEL